MNSQQQRKEKIVPADFIVPALLVAAGISIRAYRLGDKILWTDEGYDYHVATLGSIAAIRQYLSMAALGPLPGIIDHFWLGIFGKSVFGIHLETVVWSSLTLILFAVMVYRFLPRGAAACALVMFSLNAFLPEFAQTMRYHALADLMAQVWMFALLMYRENNKIAWLTVYAAATAVSLHVHFYAVFPMMMITGLALVAGSRFRLKFLPILAANAAAGATIIPRFIMMSGSGASGLAPHIPLGDVLAHLAKVPVGGIARVFFAMIAGRIVPVEGFGLCLAGLITILALAVLALSLLDKQHRDEALFCGLVFFGVVLIGWTGMMFRGLYFHDKYFVPYYGFLAIAMGIGADWLRRRVRPAGPLLLAGFLVLSFGVLHVYWSRLDRPENLKTLFAYVDKNIRPCDFLNISPPYSFTLSYYWNDRIPMHDFSGDFNPETRPHSDLYLLRREQYQVTEEEMLRWHRKLASRYKRVWMFWMYGERNTEDDRSVAAAWLDSHYRRIETRKYRLFPYSDGYSGEMALYEVRPVAGVLGSSQSIKCQ